MDSTPTAVERYSVERIARMPWLSAPDGSFWRVTGKYPGGRGDFQDCVVVALPGHVTASERPVFAFLPPLEGYLEPDSVELGVELDLVRADDGTRVDIYGA